MSIIILLMLLGIIGVLILAYVYVMAKFRRVVPPNYVDVVVDANGKKMYSSDTRYNAEGEAIYHEFPQWVPYIGKEVTRVYLGIMEIQLNNVTLLDSSRARFDCDLNAYFVIDDPIKAATYMPDIPTMKSQLVGILQANARGTSTTKTVQEIITNRAELVSALMSQVSGVAPNWGMKLNNIELIRFKDTPGTMTVTNLNLQREKEIERSTRESIAINEKKAIMTEAKAQEEAEKRVIAMEKAVTLTDQDKDKAIHDKEKVVQTSKFECEKVEFIKHEENVRDQQKLKGEGEKVLAQGQADAEAVKIAKKGEAEASVHQKKLEAEATGKEKLAKSLKQFNPLSKEVLIAEKVVDKDKQVYTELAKAFVNADIRFLAGGDGQGFDLAKFIQGMRIGDDDSAEAILNKLARENDLGFTNWKELKNNPEALKKLAKKLTGGSE